MEQKKCFKCGQIKPLSAFYKHKKSKDGHLNKCINCTKQDVAINRLRHTDDESWIESERMRGRKKYRKYRNVWNFQSSSRDICPLMANISRELKKLGYDTKGKEAHHWNYNEPFSVFLISRKAHRTIHQYLTVNRDDKYCYTLEGKRLESAEEAKQYFTSILTMCGLSERMDIINV